MDCIILIAPPAAGKGTQSKLISEKYHIPHISTSDLLREAINSGSKEGDKIKLIMASGKLVSDDIILDLLEKRLKQDDCLSGYILDGFPRTLNQAKKYDELLVKLNKNLGKVILFELDKEVAKNRIVGRLSCKNCGSVYNELLEESKPKKEGICDKCQGTLEHRVDDNLETFLARYDIYNEQTQPLIKYYEDKNCLYRVDSGISIEHTFKQIESIIGSFL